MTIMKLLVVVSLVGLGCSKRAPDWRAAAWTSLVKHVELKEAMCKCSAGDVECAARVSKARDDWSKQESDDSFDGADRAELDRMFVPVMTAYGTCMTTAMSGPSAN